MEGHMSYEQNWPGPIAIGGVGGSGTRVVAEILLQLGFYLGSDLNSAHDNLWFTLLLKRPRWFLKNAGTKESHIFKGLSIFEKTMTTGLQPPYAELGFIARAAVGMMFTGHDDAGAGRGLWPIKRAITMSRSKSIDRSQYRGWGWKEPNTHIYLEYLTKQFQNVQYIHLIRHGIDMAYSTNQSQLYNWGALFGIPAYDTAIPLPRRSLKYWIEANMRAITLGQKLPGRKFLVVNFDTLCMNPRREIELIMDFLGLDTQGTDMDKLERLPQFPPSAGRYKNYDLSVFRKDEIEAVRELGFVVDV